MSGSSGSDRDPGGGGVGPPGGPGQDPCLTLMTRTTLNSPDPAVLATLAPGALLTLRLLGPARPTIVAETPDGRRAGSITSAWQAQLVTCLEQGYKFQAQVLRIDGGACEVEIRPAGR